MANVGIIGFGGRGSAMMKKLTGKYPDVRLCAVCDLDAAAMPQRLKDSGYDPGQVSVFDDADALLAGQSLDGVMVATRCGTHHVFAEKVIRAGIPLFLEKPVATTPEHYAALRRAAGLQAAPVLVSFPLRASAMAQHIRKIVESGVLGAVEHAEIYNNVAYGGVYYHAWYRDNELTQGMFLQKATHDLDMVNYMLGDKKPVEVCAMTSQRVFGGNRPAGLLCKDCDIADDCVESPKNLARQHEYVHGPYCCFATDCKNEDSGSALFRYESGMHVSYSQNFFIRKKAAGRGGRLMGPEGTLVYDLYTNQIDIIDHRFPKVETIRYDANALEHFGGDDNLMDNFYELITGRTSQSIAPLEAGLLSALMCIKAKESADSHRFVDIGCE